MNRYWLTSITILLLLPPAALAQNAHAATAPAMQSVPATLASLPEADVLIYTNPQRILSEVAPKFMDAKELAEMRSTFADLKKSTGIDPSSVEYLVIALRFHKPAADLSFVAPDVMVVMGGDFSSESLLTIAQLYLQEKVHIEKYGSKSIVLMKVDQIATQAEKTPMLKSLVEIGAMPLSANSIAIGNLPYLKSAVDAAEGKERINAATLQSLLRDPNALVAASGTPLNSFAKAFGLFGTETNPRDWRCESSFGNFYAAITLSGTNINLRGAMNTDNPDTAKIISGLFSGLLQQGAGAVPDKDAQAMMQAVRMTPKDNEIVIEADIPEKLVIDFINDATKPKAVEPTKTAPRRPIRKKRR